MAQRTVKFLFDPGPKKVTADDVVRTLKQILGATGELSGWHIKKMSLASPFQIEATCSEETYRPISTFATTMRNIESEKKRPGQLSGASAKLLDAVDFVTRNVFGSVKIAPTARTAVTMNHAAVEKARKVTGRLTPSLIVHAREQIGQLRGYLEQITVKHGKAPRFGIRDRISNTVVDCVIPEDNSTLLGKAAGLLARRVLVTGIIRYGDHSQPTSIKAADIDEIEQFVIPFDKLPKAPLTTDGNAVANVRRLRDG